MKNKYERDRLTIRFEPHEKFIIDELVKTLGVGYSNLIRTIVMNFITKNEETLERIIDKKNENECQQ
jgi:hypothetical protein